MNHSEKIKERSWQYTKNNKKRVYERNRQYYLNHLDQVVENKKQYYIKNWDKIVEQHKDYRKRNHEKYECLNKFRYAIRTGKFKRKPCIVCGNPKSEGHHSNYSFPYRVTWYCRKHHLKNHRLIP
jgi:hypothetical protein